MTEHVPPDTTEKDIYEDVVKEMMPELLGEVSKELWDATHKFGRFNSYHEGYAVIKEELDELWEEVRKWPKSHSLEKMHKECVQLAAMALRFLVDLPPE